MVLAGSVLGKAWLGLMLLFSASSILTSFMLLETGMVTVSDYVVLHWSLFAYQLLLLVIGHVRLSPTRIVLADMPLCVVNGSFLYVSLGFLDAGKMTDGALIYMVPLMGFIPLWLSWAPGALVVWLAMKLGGVILNRLKSSKAGNK